MEGGVIWMDGRKGGGSVVKEKVHLEGRKDERNK
jgi:hypothetical protein